MAGVGERYLVDARRDGADLRAMTCTYPLLWQESFTRTGQAVQTPPAANVRPLLWPWQPLISTLLIPMSAISAAVVATLFVLRRRSAIS